MKKKIVIIGAGEYQNALIKKAREEGLETHVFAWQCKDPGEYTADFFYPISITRIDEILDICKSLQPAAVATIASDLAAVTVIRLADALHLPGNPPECAVLAVNKYEMRKAFALAGLAVPGFVTAQAAPQEEMQEPEKEAFFSKVRQLPLPLIIKPTDRSGSRGVSRIDDYADIPEAVEKALAVSFAKQVIAEEYIEGIEYSCECISSEGRHEVIAVTRKYTEGRHCIEIGHVQPSGLSGEMLEQVKKTVFTALDALHVKTGASHTEFKITPDGEVRLIEAGARMGGDCIGSSLVPMTTGLDYVKMVLDCALGKQPSLFSSVPEGTEQKGAPLSVSAKSETVGAALIRYLFSAQDYERLLEISEKHPDRIAAISFHGEEISGPGAGDKLNVSGEISAPKDSSTRFGYYILRGNCREELIAMAGLEDKEERTEFQE